MPACLPCNHAPGSQECTPWSSRHGMRAPAPPPLDHRFASASRVPLSDPTCYPRQHRHVRSVDEPMEEREMASDERRRSKGGIPPRRWPSPLLTEELSLETLRDTTYVRLVHADHVISLAAAEGGFVEVSPKGTRSERAWSWLKRPVSSWNGRDVKEVVMAKSKSLNSWAWLGRPPADEFQFDPSKRWPQGW